MQWITVCAIAQQDNFFSIHLTAHDGLPSNVVTAVMQDSRGYIWLGTHNGLARYDGERFMVYHKKSADSNSLVAEDVLGLFEEEQQIWIATNRGICILDPLSNNFKQIPLEGVPPGVALNVSNFFRDGKGNKWFSTWSRGLFWFDTTKQAFVAYTHFLPETKGKLFNILEDRLTGNYWMAGDDGLKMYDLKTKKIYSYDDNPLQIPALNERSFAHCDIPGFIIDQDNILWMNIWSAKESKSYYYTYDLRTGVKNSYTPSPDLNHWYFLDKHNKLWLKGNLFNEYNKKDKKFEQLSPAFKQQYGIHFKTVFGILEDKEQNYWLATNNGVFILTNNTQKIFSRDVGRSILSCLPLKNGHYWMGSWGYGITEYDSQLNEVTTFDLTKQSTDDNYGKVWYLLHAKTGEILAGCQFGRLWIYYPDEKKFELLQPEAFDQQNVRTMAEDKAGNTWFGTTGGLLVVRDAITKKIERYSDNRLPPAAIGDITRIVIDQQDKVWIATLNSGLIQKDAQKKVVLHVYTPVSNDPNTISSVSINDMLEYDDSTLVLATAAGINVFNKNNKTVQRIHPQDGAWDNNVGNICKDANGNLWMAMTGGVVKLTWLAKKVTFHRFKDPTVNDYFNFASSFRLKNGMIVAGSRTGFIYFNPDELEALKAPPDVRITGFNVFNQPLLIDSLISRQQPVQLTHRQNFITINFAALTYPNGKDLTYYYQLEGIDKDWVKAGRFQIASYTDLPAGHRTFKVKCENDEGIASKNITAFTLYIKPPFWRSWWFFTLVGGIVIMAFYMLYRMRMNRILAMERVRSRIARDLHDDMGSTLSTIKILSEMTRLRVDHDADKKNEYLEKISENSTRLMRSMSDIVWSINPTNDSMQKITARMREFAASVLEPKNIEYTFQVHEEVKNMKLDMESRRDLFLIFKEAVNNLAKYAQCRNASIDISMRKSSLVLLIQDDGIGFDTNTADAGNGLGNMHKRAITLKGNLVIESRQGVGTRVILEVPVS